MGNTPQHEIIHPSSKPQLDAHPHTLYNKTVPFLKLPSLLLSVILSNLDVVTILSCRTLSSFFIQKIFSKKENREILFKEKDILVDLSIYFESFFGNVERPSRSYLDEAIGMFIQDSRFLVEKVVPYVRGITIHDKYWYQIDDQFVQRMEILPHLKRFEMLYCEDVSLKGIETILESAADLEVVSFELCHSLQVDRVLQKICMYNPKITSITLVGGFIAEPNSLKFLSMCENLKHLSFGDVVFPVDAFNYFLSSYNVLESLSLEKCDIAGLKITGQHIQYLNLQFIQP
eukprot:TRINITY_DN6059_c0_g1_i1.p1 TRINITY_DN6059_c0_g1~~TRINITY_DN6059_c0_g1_i1.p1  ORF type:complete len:288 (-),score=41.96 TRINITY_DN6059_c0_g1_i1:103-966(-)